MFDKDGKLDERSQRILSEQTIPPRYGQSPGMQALSVMPEMTATELVAAEKALFAEFAAKKASEPDPLEPVIDRMLDILKEHGHLNERVNGS